MKSNLEREGWSYIQASKSAPVDPHAKTGGRISVPVSAV